MFWRNSIPALLAVASLSSNVVVNAQSNINVTYVTGLVNALNQLNLTSFVGAVTKIQNSTAAQALLGNISSGAPYTVFVPNNDAFAGVNPYFGNDDNWLGQVLAYHVVPQNISLDSIAAAPEVTTFETVLTDPSVVKLGGQGQTLGLTRGTNKTRIANQNAPGSYIIGQAQYENLQVYIVTAVIDLPPSPIDLLSEQDLGLDVANQVTSLVQQLGQFPPELAQLFLQLQKVTLFAPINSAFATAIQYNRIPSEQSLLEVLVANHVIPGELVFTGSEQKDYTSAAGQTITVGTGGLDDGKGSVVYYKGQLVANIVKGDIATQNGVIHLIDAVLPNTEGQLPTGGSQRRTLVNSRLFGRRAVPLVRED